MKKKLDIHQKAELSLKIFGYYIIFAICFWLGFVFYAIANYGTGIKW